MSRLGDSPQALGNTCRGPPILGQPLHAVDGGVKPLIYGEQGAFETTRCSAGHQGVTSGQAASRLLRCAPALRVPQHNPLVRWVFMAGSELPAISAPICENTCLQDVNPYILCSPFSGAFA